jgi:cyclophilin family peptidyl-prolyl cis-trans isomerase
MERSYRNEVRLETAQGNIDIGLYEETVVSSENFEKLVKEGFYDGTIFHRIMPDL